MNQRVESDWIINHGMEIREFANCVWIIDPQFSFFVCTVEFSLQHLSYGTVGSPAIGLMGLSGRALTVGWDIYMDER
ncbi:hypothetical protein ZWY2020_043715 [Hordeum vulgare]|nr:hypothetical protein ZWY2020_043715 [Hordeum vulgare]